jgi:hypothetical protein
METGKLEPGCDWLGQLGGEFGFLALCDDDADQAITEGSGDCGLDSLYIAAGCWIFVIDIH